MQRQQLLKETESCQSEGIATLLFKFLIPMYL